MVAPVRCATPGTEVDWATQPSDSAISTIQSASTPPPWPPMARMAIDKGLSRGKRWIAGASASIVATSRKLDPPRLAPALKPSDQCTTQVGNKAVPPRRIENHVGPVERGAQHRGLGYLAAIAAADAGVVDGGDCIILERIVGMLERERWATGQPDAGMIAGAHILVDTEALFHGASAACDQLVELRPHAPLLVQHAFRRRNNDLWTNLFCGQRVAERVAKTRDIVGPVNLPNPGRAAPLARRNDRIVGFAPPIVRP